MHTRKNDHKTRRHSVRKPFFSAALLFFIIVKFQDSAEFSSARTINEFLMVFIAGNYTISGQFVCINKNHNEIFIGKTQSLKVLKEFLKTLCENMTFQSVLHDEQSVPLSLKDDQWFKSNVPWSTPSLAKHQQCNTLLGDL